MKVAITGCAGSGKTTVLKILREYGYKTVDLDELSVQLVRNDILVQKKIEHYLKGPIVCEGRVDFKRIGYYFDKNIDDELDFECWYQPYMGKLIREQMKDLRASELIIFDVPFLSNKGLSDCFNEIWVIKAPPNKCADRIFRRNGYTDEKIKYLIERSLPSKETLDRADLILKNDGTLTELKTAVLSAVSASRRNPMASI